MYRHVACAASLSWDSPDREVRNFGTLVYCFITSQAGNGLLLDCEHRCGLFTYNLDFFNHRTSPEGWKKYSHSFCVVKSRTGLWYNPPTKCLLVGMLLAQLPALLQTSAVTIFLCFSRNLSIGCSDGRPTRYSHAPIACDPLIVHRRKTGVCQRISQLTKQTTSLPLTRYARTHTLWRPYMYHWSRMAN